MVWLRHVRADVTRVALPLAAAPRSLLCTVIFVLCILGVAFLDVVVHSPMALGLRPDSCVTFTV